MGGNPLKYIDPLGLAEFMLVGRGQHFVITGQLQEGDNIEGSALNPLALLKYSLKTGAALGIGELAAARYLAGVGRYCRPPAKGGKEFSSQIDKASKAINDFLGKGATLKKNKAGDPIFVNKDNTKRIRFDVKNPHGDKPHGHVEIKRGKRWKDFTSEHRIYLKR